MPVWGLCGGNEAKEKTNKINLYLPSSFTVTQRKKKKRKAHNDLNPAGSST